MSKKKISIVGAVVVALAIIGSACGWWFGYEAPHREALASYEVQELETRRVFG